MNAYRDLLFDLDGTLVNSFEGVANGILHAARRLGLSLPQRDELRAALGPPLSDSFERFFGLRGEDNARAVALYREYYRERGSLESSLYPGIPELLSRLTSAGFRLSVATTKLEAAALPVLRSFGIAEQFSLIVGSDEACGRCSKADVVRHILATLKIAPGGALMIGDRCYDAEGANAAGVDCIGVLWGFGAKEELISSGCIQIADTPERLAELLLRA